MVFRHYFMNMYCEHLLSCLAGWFSRTDCKYSTLLLFMRSQISCLHLVSAFLQRLPLSLSFQKLSPVFICLEEFLCFLHQFDQVDNWQMQQLSKAISLLNKRPRGLNVDAFFKSLSLVSVWRLRPVNEIKRKWWMIFFYWKEREKPSCYDCFSIGLSWIVNSSAEN